MNDLNQWVPWKLINDEPGASIQWLFTGDKYFSEPFFDETIAYCRRMFQNRKYKSLSGFEMMIDWSKKTDAVSPSAIIFHVSRCGSTLLSQFLSCDPCNIVLSEVPFLDEILRLPFRNEKFSTTTSIFLDAAICFYGQRKNSLHNHLFIKTDSWHLHFYEQFRQLYPGIPFILLYRHPYEVFQSQKKQRGLHAIPGIIEPGVFNFPKNDDVFDFDMHLINVLESYYQKCITIIQNDAMAFAFNYERGLINIAQDIYALLGIKAGELIAQKWNERSLFHAKKPKEIFVEEYSKMNMPHLLNPVFNSYQELNSLTRK